MSLALVRTLFDATMLRFVLVGLVNTAVGYGVILAAHGLLGLGHVAANAAGYACGLAVSFVLNRRFTFRHEGRAAAAALRFLAVFAVAYGVNLAVLLGLVDGLGVAGPLAQALAMVAYTAVFYLLSRFVVFV